MNVFARHTKIAQMNEKNNGLRLIESQFSNPKLTVTMRVIISEYLYNISNVSRCVYTHCVICFHYISVKCGMSSSLHYIRKKSALVFQMPTIYNRWKQG